MSDKIRPPCTVWADHQIFEEGERVGYATDREGAAEARTCLPNASSDEMHTLSVKLPPSGFGN